MKAKTLFSMVMAVICHFSVAQAAGFTNARESIVSPLSISKSIGQTELSALLSGSHLQLKVDGERFVISAQSDANSDSMMMPSAKDTGVSMLGNCRRKVVSTFETQREDVTMTVDSYISANIFCSSEPRNIKVTLSIIEKATQNMSTVILENK